MARYLTCTVAHNCRVDSHTHCFNRHPSDEEPVLKQKHENIAVTLQRPSLAIHVTWFSWLPTLFTSWLSWPSWRGLVLPSSWLPSLPSWPKTHRQCHCRPQCRPLRRNRPWYRAGLLHEVETWSQPLMLPSPRQTLLFTAESWEMWNCTTSESMTPSTKFNRSGIRSSQSSMMKAAADIQLYVVALLLGLEQIERSTARDEEQGERRSIVANVTQQGLGYQECPELKFWCLITEKQKWSKLNIMHRQIQVPLMSMSKP